MGILASKKQETQFLSSKRQSAQLDFGNLALLKSAGAIGFSSFRGHDPSAQRKSGKESNRSIGAAMAEDSDEEDEVDDLIEEAHNADVKASSSPNDADSLVDGVSRIKVCF
jgi:hypothetical protein